MMATLRHVTAWAGRPKYQANGFLFDGVYNLKTFTQNIVPTYTLLSTNNTSHPFLHYLKGDSLHGKKYSTKNDQGTTPKTSH